MLPKQPAIVGAIADLDTLSALPELSQTIALCDFIELRIDALLERESLLCECISNLTIPQVITVRDPAEGGMNALSEVERAQRMNQFLPHASVLDVEIRNLETFQAVAAEAQCQNVTVLGSFHDFQATPSHGDLLATVDRGRQAGADAIKIAVTLRDAEDLHALLTLFEEQSPQIPMAVMGMGPLGMSSRVLFAECGSLLTYTYLKHANAPGQWSTTTMRSLFNDLGIPRAIPLDA